jgi:hypothetical protein
VAAREKASDQEKKDREDKRLQNVTRESHIQKPYPNAISRRKDEMMVAES